MLGTMQEYPLTVSSLFRHGRQVYGASRVVTLEEKGTRSKTFAEVAERAERLAAALRQLGIAPGDRVGTFCWNTQEHLEAYLAVPSMGAVLHTLNIRLFPEQLAYVINHAEDKVVLVEDSLVPPPGQPQGRGLQPPLPLAALVRHHQRGHLRHHRARSAAADRAHVPRQRLGHALRVLARGDGPAHARPVPAAGPPLPLQLAGETH